LDDRFEALKRWLSRILPRDDIDVRPASVDASFRRYFRARVASDSYIVVDAPPDKEDMRAFIRISGRFHALGLNVPRVLARDIEQGFFLITDLGDRLYLHHLNESTVEYLYADAMNALAVLQAGSHNQSDGLPDCDSKMLHSEMGLFHEWYLSRHLKHSLSSRHQRILNDVYGRLADTALAQPRVWVHRDYHSRNLMLTDENNPGILDFQDAVHGPVTYDLVSLLRDCYIAWPHSRVEQWTKGYFALAHQSGIPVGNDEKLFIRWFDWMGVQRHLKATGIFARLFLRDGKPGYLDDIPRTMAYVRDVSARYPELEPLHALLTELKAPEPRR
jgi:hypothetical protein